MLLFRFPRRFSPILFALAASSGMSQASTAALTSAQEAASDAITVDVVGKAPDRDQHDYHDTLKGVEAFNKYHYLAPQAELHFRLYQRNEKLDRDGVKLHLKSDSVRRDIELSTNWEFDLPIDAVADKERGDLVTNRPEKSFAWRPSIRTPGLPDNTRRLGDLRLECEVDFAAGLTVVPPSPGNLVLLAARPNIDVCSMPSVHWAFLADQPVFGITLINKERRWPLQTTVWLYAIHEPPVAKPLVDFMHLNDRVYDLPMADASWPDDTLVEFDYMEDPQPHSQQANASAAQSAIN